MLIPLPSRPKNKGTTMIKHVGKHKNKKVVLLFRKVPGEDHMCLVAYSDNLPNLYHDTVMKLLESAAGQQSDNFSDVLFRNFMPDGRNCLESLHKGNHIKKVPTDQILITPNSTSSIVLTELNRLLDEMGKGNDAIRRLKELDDEQAKSKKTSSTRSSDISVNTSVSNDVGSDVLSDRDLAVQRIKQAETMRADAARLLKEADILMEEAATLDPTVNDNTKKKSTAKTKKS